MWMKDPSCAHCWWVFLIFPRVNERASGWYLVLAGEPGIAEVQVLVGFPQAAQLPLQTHPFQLEGAKLSSQHGALSQQLRLQRQPLLLLSLEPATAQRPSLTAATLLWSPLTLQGHSPETHTTYSLLGKADLNLIVLYQSAKRQT